MPGRIVDASGKMAGAARACRPEGCGVKATPPSAGFQARAGSRHAPGIRRRTRGLRARNAAHGNFAISSMNNMIFCFVLLLTLSNALAEPPQAAQRPQRSFTIGSNSGEVEAAQGRPDKIERYPALGYDIWRYGDSQVRISTKDNIVIEWIDLSRNLKAVEPPPAAKPPVNPTRASNQSVGFHFDSSFEAFVDQSYSADSTVQQPPSFIGISGDGTNNMFVPRRNRRGDRNGFRIPGLSGGIPGVPGSIEYPGCGSLDINVGEKPSRDSLKNPRQENKPTLP